MEYNHNYIYIENLFSILYNWFYSCCKKRQVPEVTEDLEKLLLYSVETKNKDMVLQYIMKGAKNLNDCLKLACEKGYYQIADFLVEKGADPIVGLRYSKSVNITRIMYKHIQKSEINN